VKISVALCCYNGSAYLGEQLASLEWQTVRPSEVVVCDDGSTDDTLRLVENFSRRVPFPVRTHVNQENLQFTGNFLKAASLCTGDIIAFCDQDDIWEPEKLERCAHAMALEAADLLVHEGRVVVATGRRTAARIPDFSHAPDRLTEPPFEHAAKGFAMLVRREVIGRFMAAWDWADYLNLKRQHGAPLGHDLLLYATCLGQGKTTFLRQELVRYRIHEHNLTATEVTTRSRFSRLLSFFSKITFDPSRYARPGRKWAAEAEFLGRYLERCSPASVPGLQRLREYCEIKSYLWSRRAGLYERERGRLDRSGRFMNLLVSGGYRPSRTPTLGLRGLAKDALVTLFL
jgi:glycosyltransferase involved in cell wall biosynthesis